LIDKIIGKRTRLGEPKGVALAHVLKEEEGEEIPIMGSNVPNATRRTTL